MCFGYEGSEVSIRHRQRVHLDPVARLEAAVRVDPKPVRVAGQHARVDELLDLGAQRVHRRHRRRVHVVDARPCNK